MVLCSWPADEDGTDCYPYDVPYSYLSARGVPMGGAGVEGTGDRGDTEHVDNLYI